MVKARAPKRKEPESQAAQAGYRAQDMTPEYSGRFSFSGEGEQRPCRRGASLHTSLSLSLSLALSLSLPPSLARSFFFYHFFPLSLSLCLSLALPCSVEAENGKPPPQASKGRPTFAGFQRHLKCPGLSRSASVSLATRTRLRSFVPYFV